MGNEKSQLTGLEIDEKAVEVTDFWTHSSAVLYKTDVTSLSVFIGESLAEGSLWRHNTPLEKFTKNLMLHRHPCILKYISSWVKGGKVHLAVEHVKPLAHAVTGQTPLQICIGLHSVLKAVTFLHEKALSSHNNICAAAVYVTKDGSWKLGGLEYLCRFQDMSPDYLSKTRMHRYEKAIDPNEESSSSNEKFLKTGAIDKYAFAVLVDELLHKMASDDIPCLEDFKQFCKTELQRQDVESRPNFSSVLEHPYFSHDFIIICSFLTELPLKSNQEKEAFFREITVKLRRFPEQIVARQLGELLLSRLVLLDKTAQNKLLPYVLMPKQEQNNADDSDNERDGSIFSEKTFELYIIPKLLHIFCVRDAQIRLLLLQHFKSYMLYFSRQQLQNDILPELLIGIKDTSDHLVSVTLAALSDLVPILGAATVIGGKRLKLFNDGRPSADLRKREPVPKASHRSNSVCEQSDFLGSGSSIVAAKGELEGLPERLSPDGGEDEIPTLELVQIVEDDLDNWSDWDNEENNNAHVVSRSEQIETERLDNDERELLDFNNKSDVLPHHPVEQLPDISMLDIKNIQHQETIKEFNFFSDMEPMIEKTNKFFIEDSEREDINDSFSRRINVDMNASEENHINEEGWGEDLSWVEN